MLLAASAAALAGWAALKEAPRRPVITPALTPATDGARIFYPASRRPVLQLPAGRQQPIRSLLNIRAPMNFGEHVWNDQGVPVGSLWIRIDLSRQIISVFRSGHEIGSAVILYGTDGKPTPTGVFRILERAREHRSSLYDAEMPFMLRLTNDGVAIHASNVRKGSATHGCIGIPRDFAQLLFAAARRGDLVVIVNDPATTVREFVSAGAGEPALHNL